MRSTRQRIAEQLNAFAVPIAPMALWVSLSGEGFHVRPDGKEALIRVAGLVASQLSTDDLPRLQKAFLDVRTH